MEEIAISKQFRGYTIHYVDQGGNGYLSRYNQVYRVNSEGHILLLSTIPYTKPVYRFLKYNLVERLARANISHVLPLIDNSLLVFFDHKIYKLDHNGIQSEYYIESCRRPVNIYYNYSTGRILWGDYLIGNNNRINIYESKDLGKSWDILYTFPRGVIRHVHNIVFDNHNRHFWVLTGDNNQESGIWKTEDFKDLEPFLVGSQSYRSMSIIPTPEGIIIPTDAEYSANYIQFYSFKDQAISVLQKLNGSAFFAAKINDYYFVSTVYEPNSVTKHKFAEMWYSKNITDWTKVLRFKKDIFPTKLFRYPSIKIPKYESGYCLDKFYFSTRSVKLAPYIMILGVDEL